MLTKGLFAFNEFSRLNHCSTCFSLILLQSSFVLQGVDELVDWIVDRQLYLEDEVCILRLYAFLLEKVGPLPMNPHIIVQISPKCAFSFLDFGEKHRQDFPLLSTTT